MKTRKSGRGEINGNPVEAMDEFIIVPHAGINITGIGLIFNCHEFSATVVITTLSRWLFMVTVLICCWQKHYVSHFFQCKRSVTTTSNRSSLSNTCHQHKLFPTSVTNIDVAEFSKEKRKPNKSIWFAHNLYFQSDSRYSFYWCYWRSLLKQ